MSLSKVFKIETTLSRGMNGSCHWRVSIDEILDEENMDMSPQTNYHMAYSEAVDTPNLTESSLSVTSLEDKDQ